MRSVLMIAYGFPPEGNAGTYRPLRFVQHLPTLDWKVSVITASRSHYERYDPGLVALVPSGIEIVRVASRDFWEDIQAKRAKRTQERAVKTAGKTGSLIHNTTSTSIRSLFREVVSTAEAWCYHPDMAMGWIRPAIKATSQVCARKRPNVIWATGGPWSSFIVAQRASQQTGVPYVLDFRDSWTITISEFEARRPRWAKRWDRRTLYRLLKGAQSVIFRYDTEAECFWRSYHGALEAPRIHLIPNGYEGAIDEFALPYGDKCMILYTGTLSSYRYDTLLEALSWFKKSDPVRVRQLRLVFVGEATEALANHASALGLSDLIATKSPTSFDEINRLQRQAHALLVLGRQPTIKGYELLAGAKLFSYLKAGRPIIGVLPRDETRKILHRVGVSTIADVDSPCEILSVLQRLHDVWSAGTLAALLPDRSACEVYSAERQTAALVRALQGEPPVEPFAPGSVEIPPSLQGEIGNGGWLNGD